MSKRKDNHHEIYRSKKILHESPFKGEPVEKPIIMEKLTKVLEKNSLDIKECVQKTEPDAFHLKNVSEMNLHSFVLEMEKLGKTVELEKSFTITVQ